MDAQEFRSLQEAYVEVYELDEANRGDEYVTSSMYMSREPETTAAKVRRRQKRDGLPDNPSHQGDDKDYDRQFAHRVERGRKKLKPHSSETLEGDNKNKNTATGKYAAMQRRKRQGLSYKEQVDLYDIILSHLLDEGYAETPEAAEVIMVNMSEEWREEVLDERNRGERDMSPQEVRYRRDRRDGDTTSGGFKPYVRAGGSQEADHKRSRGVKKQKGKVLPHMRGPNANVSNYYAVRGEN